MLAVICFSKLWGRKLPFVVLVFVASVNITIVAYCDVIDTPSVALSVGAISDGMHDVISGTAEQNADAAFERAMNANVATFKCRVGAQNGEVAFNRTETVPNVPDEFLSLRAKYIKLAQKVKETKNALGMPPRIESQEIINDKSNLYNYSPFGGIKHVFDDIGNPNEKIARGLESVQVGIYRRRNVQGSEILRL